MRTYRQYRALRILDHAIESLGKTKPCGLLIMDGKAYQLPADSDPKNAARAILAKAMCQIVSESFS